MRFGGFIVTVTIVSRPPLPTEAFAFGTASASLARRTLTTTTTSVIKHAACGVTHLHKSTTLMSTAQDDDAASSSDKDEPTSSPAAAAATDVQKLDSSAIAKYFMAIGIQMSLIYSFFMALDKIGASVSFPIPTAVNFIIFYVLALKSRIFNPLSNQRPKVQTLETATTNKRKMPSWTPPGFVFPIVWLLIIGPIRAATSTAIVKALGCYANPTIMALMLHLSIGDVWNTINNVEQRYGVSVMGVLCVWLSKAHAAYRYYQVVPLAGKVLGVTLVWLTIASTLITATWRLNPDPTTGKPEPLYPTVTQGEPSKTQFAWFSS